VAIDRDSDLDALVRTAMKTLDDQAPSGYFEALPGRTVARLAHPEATMETATSTSGSEGTSTGIPPTPEEDSGLHDIRNLAASTMERISNKRISASTIKTEDELLASTSGSWKNLALPQPASMISLPEIAELPAADVVKAKAKDKPAFGAHVAAKGARTASRRNIAIAGVGLAAAAGVTLFVTMRTKGVAPDAAPAMQVERAKTAMAATPVTAAAPAPVAPTVQHIDEPTGSTGMGNAAAAGSAVEIAAASPEPPPAPVAKILPTKKAAPKASSHASAKPVAISKTDAATASETKAPASTTQAPAKQKSGDESFDQLLKEAGVQDQKKDQKPVLDKKELSASDFKAGMASITSKAQGCFKGTQGMAQVKLVIAPSGKVTKVTVSGVFAGKPEAGCVTGAVKSATFPPWDGGSQTMGYSFLLSE
jgi:hypothetical protein